MESPITLNAYSRYSLSLGRKRGPIWDPYIFFPNSPPNFEGYPIRARAGQHRSRIRILRFFSFLKFNEFYDIFRLKKIRKKFVILQIIDV